MTVERGPALGSRPTLNTRATDVKQDWQACSSQANIVSPHFSLDYKLYDTFLQTTALYGSLLQLTEEQLVNLLVNLFKHHTKPWS